MRRKIEQKHAMIRTVLAVAAAFIVLVSVSQASHNSHPLPLYKIQVIGSLSPYGSVAKAVTGRGEVIGVSDLSSSVAGQRLRHAFVWKGVVLRDLDNYRTTLISQANGANDHGDYVGAEWSGVGGERACVWQGKNLQLLQSIGGDKSLAYGVNQFGAVCGQADVRGGVAYHAVLWQNGKAVDINGTKASQSAARSINSVGEMAGSAYLGRELHAVVWQGMRMHLLEHLKGALSSEAVGINDKGTVCGTSTLLGNRSTAVIWRPGNVPISLGTLGGNSSFAEAINNNGEVVGEADTRSGKRHAFLWFAGHMQDLNDLVRANTWVVNEAHAINNSGLIAGAGVLRGKQEALLVSPAS